MNNIKNEAGINEIRMEKRLTLYCPMGHDYYIADVSIYIVPGAEIMDYCETNEFLKSMSGGEYIIEDAVAAIYNHIMEGIKPEFARVAIKATNGAHMPVVVAKETRAMVSGGNQHE